MPIPGFFSSGNAGKKVEAKQETKELTAIAFWHQQFKTLNKALAVAKSTKNSAKIDEINNEMLSLNSLEKAMREDRLNPYTPMSEVMQMIAATDEAKNLESVDHTASSSTSTSIKCERM